MVTSYPLWGLGRTGKLRLKSKRLLKEYAVSQTMFKRQIYCLRVKYRIAVFHHPLVAPRGALSEIVLPRITSFKMHFSSLPGIVTLALAFQGGVKAAASEEQKLLDPCTISSSSGSFYDLRSLSVLPPDDGKKSTKGADRTESWHVKGYDYHSNFTLNICAPVVEDIDDVVGVNTKLWPNVSAFYESKGKTYSLG